jgi:hypothetical protein
LEAVQESVEPPEPPVIAVGARLQLSPVLGDTASVRVTVSVKPLAGATVIVEERGEPTLPFKLVGFAVTVKSSMVKVVVAECESVPLVPVMVSV